MIHRYLPRSLKLESLSQLPFIGYDRYIYIYNNNNNNNNNNNIKLKYIILILAFFIYCC